MGTHYEVLGLTPEATDDEITDRYHELAKVVHPDVGGDAVTFDVLSDTYAVLADPATRAEYDAELTSKLVTNSDETTSTPPAHGATRAGVYAEEFAVRRAAPDWRARSTAEERRAALDHPWWDPYNPHRMHLEPAEYGRRALKQVALAIGSLALAGAVYGILLLVRSF